MKYNFTTQLPEQKGKHIYWCELHGCATALAIVEAAQQNNQLLVVITPDIAHIAKLESELKFFAKGLQLPLLTFPDWEILPYDRFSPHQDIISERLLTLHKLLSAPKGVLLVSIHTLMQRIAPKEYLSNNVFYLKKNECVNLTDFRNNLINRGYYCVNQVSQHGEFSIRGSIIDLFAMGLSTPYRIDLFDNEIDTIREFDPDSQRSIKEIETIKLLPAKEFPLNQESISLFQTKWHKTFSDVSTNSPVYQNVANGSLAAGIEYYLPLFFEKTGTLFDYLPENSILIKTRKLNEDASQYWQEVNQRYEQLRYDYLHPTLPPIDIIMPTNELFGNLNKFVNIQIDNNYEHYNKHLANCFNSYYLPDITFNHHDQIPHKKLEHFLSTIKHRVLFCAESLGRREALIEQLRQIQIHPEELKSWQDFLSSNSQYGICIGQLERGCKFDNITIIPESELVGQQVMQRRRRKSDKDRDPGAAVRNLTELTIGDPIVHLEHGIGKYLGLETITAGEYPSEFLTIEYANNSKLYVPITSLHLIGRYLGSDSDSVVYNTLGSKQWEKSKRKAIEKIRDVAAELLDIYARRATKKGFIYHIDKVQYQQFARTFPFETTFDQQTAIDQVLKDMSSENSMDRLICGDVGFGKTEVAMRAAYIAVMNNKQVAILTPTTLLTQQHTTNFHDRFAGLPITISSLSRFNSKKEQQLIINQINNGIVDIVIGTHKLLQSDIHFKDLSLLIIDEEHRFGVKQKEQIKSLRANIDILALTATPIPRSLNMGLVGVRDLSIIATPPQKRLSIKTFIQEYNAQQIREAMLREIMRGGQIYFLHNDIETINNVANELKILVPAARVTIAHGQMPERQLEQIMSDFYHQRFNLLVCTTIIESGIDVPTANTIIINRADRFGLAQLHQLRGRVGRSHHQAYAYIIAPPNKNLTKNAKKRLEAIECMGDLGVGFTLATHDLEIRGAGEILGEEQSGQIQSIGFNLYMEFLEQAVAALKSGNEVDFSQPLLQSDPQIDLQVPALIPEDYIFDVHTRLTFYKKIANATNNQQLKELQVELTDRFGLMPENVKNIFLIRKLQTKINKIGAKNIKASLQQGKIEFTETPRIDPQKLISLIRTHPDIYRFTPPNKLTFKITHSSHADLIKFIEQLFDNLSIVKT